MIAEDWLRSVALALPDVQEKETWGKPTFRVGRKLFLTLAPDGSTATMKASLGNQAELVAKDPEVFSIAPYVGRYGWIKVSLDRCDFDLLEELVHVAWSQSAPRDICARRKCRPSLS
ncbi:MmcQ/YjbR family DNA-binding protein [Ferrimicrobium sp.]|uniref:MmcQ/YjbR family DNA-binding protein n=1 Tax=Ferrimicrobium sp. TaxID=2926050 RepID=UPI0026133179|nr:MmcQ/YjbR family DNA-binding protein [Ferrimicrobium sp.]